MMQRGWTWPEMSALKVKHTEYHNGISNASSYHDVCAIDGNVYGEDGIFHCSRSLFEVPTFHSGQLHLPLRAGGLKYPTSLHQCTWKSSTPFSKDSWFFMWWIRLQSFIHRQALWKSLTMSRHSHFSAQCRRFSSRMRSFALAFNSLKTLLFWGVGYLAAVFWAYWRDLMTSSFASFQKYT